MIDWRNMMQKTINNQNWSLGKHALITGAASGIGKSIAFGLLGKCRKLTLLSRNKDSSLDDIVKALRADSNNKVFTTEISQSSSIIIATSSPLVSNQCFIALR